MRVSGHKPNGCGRRLGGPLREKKEVRLHDVVDVDLLHPSDHRLAHLFALCIIIEAVLLTFLTFLPSSGCWSSVPLAILSWG